MKNKLENIMIEIFETKKLYNRTENEDIKKHYDFYINLLIENDAPNEYKNDLNRIWDKIK